MLLVEKSHDDQRKGKPHATVDIVTELFFRIEDALKGVCKHSQALLYPSEIVTNCFLIEPSLLSVIDRYGIELIHPVCEGRSEQQIGQKGLSNWRWIVGGEAEMAGPGARVGAGECIPIPGESETLNAAVPAAILLFEVVRQRSAVP